jgi:hypothetical protein
MVLAVWFGAGAWIGATWIAVLLAAVAVGATSVGGWAPGLAATAIVLIGMLAGNASDPNRMWRWSNLLPLLAPDCC